MYLLFPRDFKGQIRTSDRRCIHTSWYLDKAAHMHTLYLGINSKNVNKVHVTTDQQDNVHGIHYFKNTLFIIFMKSSDTVSNDLRMNAYVMKSNIL